MQLFTEVEFHRPQTELIVITGFVTLETAKESFHKVVFDFSAKPKPRFGRPRPAGLGTLSTYHLGTPLRASSKGGV